MIRPAFFISDSTGITAETLGKSILAQFENLNFEHIIVPYVDNLEKAHAAVQRINRAAEERGVTPIIFDTLVNESIREVIATSQGIIVDVLGPFVRQLETALGEKPSSTVGRLKNADYDANYKNRIDAVNFALDNDDGARINRYDQAQIILIGVSRSGKTPTCLYLALQSGVFVANYPLTEEDLDDVRLPKALASHRERLFGLTIDPRRLMAIRTERRPDSPYSSLTRCEDEVRQAEALFRRFGIPYLDTTHASVEEIATRILFDSGLRGKGR
ncbi:kinase/pyrophosphorylase [Spongiibacter taiwanensis]|uniref:posphoenolpyruvate synthetase regulatory kinase/phosphorylase PpsR n=1 Tax=Spongiibacter taiwanensis TaxID=1748242 RepID=UPI00203577D4|nr:pyruvate, water dikinase regulatory protein [Spongiibacter taiwanensis]USA43464.1 kinase/pyrophosphorylase [Spongiibacter taiwanensis]